MQFSEHRSRRRVAGIALIAGPGLTLLGWTMFPSLDNSQAAWVRDVADEPTRAAAGSAIVIVGVALSALAYMALVHLLRERRPLAGDVGGGLAIVGIALIGALMGLVLAEVEVIRHLGASAETTAVIDAIDDSAAAVVLWLGPLLATIGLVVLAVGLARARTTPPLVAGLLGVGAVVQVGGFLALASLSVGLVGFAAMFVAQAFIGVHLLTETDEEWDHVPVFDGFHRVSTA